MSTIGGANNILVTSDLINSIGLNGAALVSGETGNYGPNGGFQIKCYVTATGCTSSDIYIELKDNIQWTNISCEFILAGNASCWSFNGPSYLGNLYPYDESLGDSIPNERCLNSWEYPEFQTHNKVDACDNSSNNFFHGSFQKGDPKTFLMKRRRNVNGSLAGIYHHRACLSNGPASTTIIRNIYIW